MSRDRALSRFANTIASAGAPPTALEPSATVGEVPRETGSAGRSEVVWSWSGALLGPLWPIAAGRPLAGFLGLALLIAGTVVAASLARSPLAPLVGFAGSWLAFAVLMGLFGGERAPGEADERWFRPVGALALAVVVGFVALVGWSKAQSERAALQPQLAGAIGNPVLVGRQASGWSWDGFMQDVGGIEIGGQQLPGYGDDSPGYGEPDPPVIVPPTSPPTEAQDDCQLLKEQAGSNWENDPTYNTFCGGQPAEAKR